MNDNTLIYLDNAAGSWPKPPQVARAMSEALREYGANPGRGNYALTRKTAALVEKTREKLAAMFGCPDPRRVIFTAGATMSLNMALTGLLKAGAVLLTAGMEHNAVSRPAAALEDKGLIRVRALSGDKEGYLKAEQIKEALRARPRPRLLAVNHASNVCGAVAELNPLAVAARRARIPLLLDAAQSGGYIPMDMRRQGLDALALAGHKALMGPAGIGVLLLGEKVDPEPLLHGGTGSRSEDRRQPRDYPEHLEAGSLNMPGIAGLLAGLEFVESVGREELYAHGMVLTDRLAEMAGNIRGITLYLPEEKRPRLPVLALNIRGLDPAEAAARLDKRFGICVRSGYHCAPAAHRALGTMEAGCLRFSPGWYNTLPEMELAAQALAQLARGAG